MKMQVRTLYRWLLSLPILVPCLLLPVAFLHLAPPLLERFISLASLSAVVGGIPYVVLALGLLWWMRRKSEGQIRLAMWIAPLLMVALLGLVIVCVVVIEGSAFDDDTFTAWLAYSGYALGLGYFYVAVALFVVWLAKRTATVASDGGTLLSDDREQATAGGSGGSIDRDGRSPSAPDVER